MCKNVFIISARRSGTHLLTDLITNNFNFTRIDNSIDHDFLTDKNVKTFIEEMYCGGRLAWSHFHDFTNFFERDLNEPYVESLRKIFFESKILYVYRDIRDVITSDYYRERNLKFDSFKDYYENTDMKDHKMIVNYNGSDDNLFDVISNNHRNWLSVYFSRELLNLDFEIVSYEEIITNYDNTVKKIGLFLEMDVINIKDIRLKKIDDKKKCYVYTDNDFRKGSIGDWKETFGFEWGNTIIKEYNETIKNHLNAYVFNNVLHEDHDPERKYFQINSRDWLTIGKNVDIELLNYGNVFQEFKEQYNVEDILLSRYDKDYHRCPDVRYYHKVFFINNFVLKFMYPCKAVLDRKTFNYVTPIASKINLLTILKSHNILYKLGITPKLHYGGIYNGILFVIQERLNENNLISDREEISFERWWDWMIDTDLFPSVLDMFFLAANNNILLYDINSPHNLIYHNDSLMFIDLDGILFFKDENSMKKSKEFKIIVNFLKKNNDSWIKKYGVDLMENFKSSLND